MLSGREDLHVHGFGTGSFWYEKTEESLIAMARSMVKEGVTTFLAHVKSPFHHFIRKEPYIPEGASVLIRKDSGEEYRLNRRDVEDVKNLEMGYFSSVKTIMEKHSISLEDIITMASENSAKYIGVFDQLGSMKEGKKADFMVLDTHMDLTEVYVEGVSMKIHNKEL